MVSKARQNRVKELWEGLPNTWRTELMSAFHTFIPAFALTLYTQIQLAQGVSWTKDTILAFTVATGLAALRSGFKAVSMWVLSRLLPDPR